MTVVAEHDLESWRATARRLLAADVPPEDVTWLAADRHQDVLPLDDAPDDLPAAPPRDRVPARFVAAARAVVLHRDESKWALLYRLLWRLTREDRHLLDFAADADVRRFDLMEQEVRRDAHKMHAFVRFRRLEDADGERYVAWYRPDHHIVAMTADFFVDRFRSQRWAILTPDRSAHWDGAALTFGPGLPRDAAPAEDEMETLWRAYYASVFNPARLNLKAMRAEMPTRHWATLPEAQLLPALVAAAPTRVRGMLDDRAAAPTARPFVPDSADLDVLRRAAATCTGCALHARATQTVFGQGPAQAPLLLVGEQPGDQEDLQGAPFVGPAGDVLDAGARRRRPRPRRRLPDQRGQALLMGAARQATDPPDAALLGDPGLPAVGRSGDRVGAAAPARLPGRHRGQGPARPAVPHHQGAGPDPGQPVGRAGTGDVASLGGAAGRRASPRRRIARPADRRSDARGTSRAGAPGRRAERWRRRKSTGAPRRRGSGRDPPAPRRR